MTDQEKVQDFLKNATHMVIAVVLPDGTPWAVPVKIQAWEGTMFEWVSMPNTEHSKAIMNNSPMAVTIFDNKKDNQVGVYMKGKGELLHESQEEHRYRFTASQLWLNDESYIKRRVEQASAAD